MASSSEPFVSIVVPVYNDAARLARCLAALEQQTYPPERFEVVVADNGSSDDVTAVVARHPRTRLVHEPRPGSYAARNRALGVTKGEVIAFTDSDCVPTQGWLAAGVRTLLENEGIGLVGGAVELFPRVPGRPNTVEVYELVHAFPQQRYVTEFHYAATANMFTRRAVLNVIGPFDASLRSGGDKEWGQRVFDAGYQLRYADEACVRHPARATWGEMHSKLARVTGGYLERRRREGYPLPHFLKDLAKSLVPPIGAARRGLGDGNLTTTALKLRYVVAMVAVRYLGAAERILARLRTTAPR